MQLAVDRSRQFGVHCVYWTGWPPGLEDERMTADDKKVKILAAIASRGWFTAECYWSEASALRDAGLVRLGERFSTGGHRKLVWVAP